MKKRIISALLSATLLLTPCVFSVSAEETAKPDSYLFGDANFDSYVTIYDVTRLQRYLAEYNIEEAPVYGGRYTKDGSLMTTEAIIEYACDVNNDGHADIQDATLIQKYLAGLDVKDTNLGKIAFEWRDAEYRNVYPNKEVEVVDEEAYDEQKLVIDKETITIKHPIYKSGYDCICNDCDMVMRWNNGKAFTSTEILNHLNSHTNTNQLPTLTPNLARYYVDAYGQKRPVGPGYSVWVTFKDENGNLYKKDMPYDESLPLYHGNGSNGSYRYTYTTNIPTGEYEEIKVPARVPVYTSGEAYIATATGEVLYHADGVAWTPSEFGWFIERRAQEGYDNGLSGQELIAYTGRIEKQWTDKIPTGEFTDQPLEGCYHYEMVHHDAVTHTKEITDYDAEPIDKKLIKPEGYYAVQ
ncbi:dockerin type I repeat-containing protein [Ruminococcus difficilis]|uniref:Dockerin type I repeat-containing protein n=1 Tax=Ruminococcus difficilis TaxID=2763069 RepID=A0A935C2Y0_9FIRM|nr:dockerin type I repeat-containing protein [Ruminococcus difficilis]MBK6089504.1 dockerin type I repeat-containing protein [Ruminococcus difficilis]